MSPEASNRERLLRLIDGKPETMPKDPGAKPVEPVSRASQAIDTWKKRAFSNGDILRLVKMALVFGVVLVALHTFSDIFKATHKPASEPQTSGPVQPSTPVPAEDESGVGLRLVGVDSSDEPVALIEDLKTGKTYFARVNDRVKDARVKQISKNKVVVFAHGRTVELR